MCMAYAQTCLQTSLARYKKRIRNSALPEFNLDNNYLWRRLLLVSRWPFISSSSFSYAELLSLIINSESHRANFTTFSLQFGQLIFHETFIYILTNKHFWYFDSTKQANSIWADHDMWNVSLWNLNKLVFIPLVHFKLCTDVVLSRKSFHSAFINISSTHGFRFTVTSR